MKDLSAASIGPWRLLLICSLLIRSLAATAQPTYCTPGNFSGCGAAPITRVQLTGTTLDNASSCQNNGFGNAFAEYPATGSATATVQQGVSYTFGVASSSSSATLAAWADWDQDGSFESSEFIGVSGGSTANVLMQTWISVPAVAVTGLTKLRIRSRANNSTINSTDACTSFASGETEDYILTIAPAPTPTSPYCVPGNFTSNCASAVVSRVQITGTTLNNTSTCQVNANGNAYVVFPATGSATATLQQGVSYTFGVTSSSSAATLAAWVDWDQDGNFESSEFIAVSGGSTANAAMQTWISVPSTAVLGQTALRIRSRASNSTINSTDACAFFGSGETEDYTITVAAAPSPSSPYCTPGNFTSNCQSAVISRVQLTGTTLDNTSACQVNSFGNAYSAFQPTGSATGTVQQGVSYQFGVTSSSSATTLAAWVDWNQNGTFESSEYTSISGGASANLPMQTWLTVPTNAVLGSTTLRVRSRASNSTINSTDACAFFGSGETEDYTITVAAAPSPGPAYCVPGNFTSNCNSAVISRVQIVGGGLDNASSCQVNSFGNAYSTFPPTGTATGTVQQGVSYQFGVTTPNSATTLAAWVDWNQNNVFESSEYISVTAGASANVPMLAWITVPATAPPGQTVMRVRSRASNSTINSTDACAFFGSGETEDYTITVAAAPSPGPAYCTPGNFTSSCSGPNITQVQLTGGGLLNNSTCQVNANGNSYAQYPASGSTLGVVQPGTTYALRITTNSSATVMAWADWNRNNSFDTNEAVSVFSSTTTGSVGLSVPAGAVTGQTTLRIRSRNGSISSSDACGFFGSGETEDYVLQVGGTVNPAYCTPGNFGGCGNGNITRVTLANTTLNNASTCQTNTQGNAFSEYPASGTTTGTVAQGTTYGLTVVPTASFGALGVWVDWNQNTQFDAAEYQPISTSTSATVAATVGLVVPATATLGQTRMRIRFRTDAGLDPATGPCATFNTGETEDYLLTVVAGPNPVPTYCVPGNFSGGCSRGTITRVKLTGTTLDNASTCAVNAFGNAYAEYPATGATTGTVAQGTSYGLSVTQDVSFGALGVWADWNQNNTFEATEYQSIRTSTIAGQAYTIGLVVPATAILGQTRMRIRFRTDAGLDPTYACVTLNTGETEDYLLTVVSGPNPVPQYCVPGNFSGGCTSGTITRVKLTGTTLDNPSACATNGFGNAYAQYAATGATTATVQPGTTYALAVTPDTDFGALGAWVDWNRNNTFEATEYQSISTSTRANQTVSVGLSVPATASLGATMMRVRFRTDAGLDAATSACAVYATGETEDYPLTVSTCALTAPTISAGSTTVLCAGTTLQLTATGVPAGATYLWSGPSFSSNLPSPQIPNVQPANSGTYTLSITLNNCSATANPLNLTVSALPTVVVQASGPTALCQGETVTLTASGAASYVWSTGATTPSITVGTAGTYSVTGTSASACQATSAPVTVTVGTRPTAAITAGGPTTFCQGGSVTLTASGGTSYLWSTGAQTPSITVASSGQYTVTATNAASCSATSAPITVTVNPQPSAAFNYAAATYCRTGANPTPTITGASGGTFSASPAGLSLNAATGQLNLAASAVGTYTITYAVTGTCAAQQSQSVTITTAPSATFSYPAGPYCAGTPGTVVPTFGAGASAGSFSAAPGGLALDPASGQIDLAASTAGTYTITNGIAAGGGCAAASATAMVVIHALPPATITAGGPTTFCLGGSVTLTAATAGAGAAYQWLLNGQPITGATQRSYMATQAGGYTVAVTSAATCSATSAPLTVTTNALPSAAFSYPSSTFCLGGPNVTPTITGLTGGRFLVSPSGQLVINMLTGVINLTTSPAGTYIVTYTVNDGQCFGSQSQTITLTTAPLATFSYAIPTACVGASPFAPTFGTGASAGVFSAQPAGLAIDAVSGTVDPATSQPGTYTVTNTVTASGSCPTVTASAVVSITAAPNATLTAGGPTTFCQGGAVTLTATGGTRYQWSSGQTSPSITVTQPGTYSVTVTNASNCAATPAPITVTVNPTPATPTITATPQGGGGVLLTSSAPSGNQWYLNGQPLAGAIGTTYLVTDPTQNGLYTVVVTGVGNCPSAPSPALNVVITATGAEVGQPRRLTLYPNPTPDGLLTVELTGYAQPVDLTLFDAVGRAVYHHLLTAPHGPQVLDLHHLPTGVYSLRVRPTDGATITRRVVRQ